MLLAFIGKSVCGKLTLYGLFSLISTLQVACNSGNRTKKPARRRWLLNKLLSPTILGNSNLRQLEPDSAFKDIYIRVEDWHWKRYAKPCSKQSEPREIYCASASAKSKVSITRARSTSSPR